MFQLFVFADMIVPPKFWDTYWLPGAYSAEVVHTTALRIAGKEVMFPELDLRASQELDTGDEDWQQAGVGCYARYGSSSLI